MGDPKGNVRPIAPHLQIYRLALTTMMSIMHRITGALLYLGTILLVWWLSAAAISDSYFAVAQGFFGHWFGKLVLFGYTWVLIHHMLGGIRHLVWDTGRAFHLTTIEWLARANLAGSIIIAILLWVIAYGLMA